MFRQRDRGMSRSEDNLRGLNASQAKESCDSWAMCCAVIMEILPAQVGLNDALSGLLLRNSPENTKSIFQEAGCASGGIQAQVRLIFHMKKDTTKTKRSDESQLLALLKKVLPKATPDPALADRIYEAIAQELKAKARTVAFEKFCEKVELPDLEMTTLKDVRQQLDAAFGDGDVTIKPNKKEGTLAVEVAMPDGEQFQSEIKVRPVSGEEGDDPEIALKFVPFPVSLPGDPELIWLLAKRENLTSEEAGIGLTKAEDAFWGSKTGQKLLRDRVERNFQEFISRAPAGLLGEAGVKRHYKTPEPLKVLRPAVPQKSPKH